MATESPVPISSKLHHQRGKDHLLWFLFKLWLAELWVIAHSWTISIGLIGPAWLLRTPSGRKPWLAALNGSMWLEWWEGEGGLLRTGMGVGRIGLCDTVTIQHGWKIWLLASRLFLFTLCYCTSPGLHNSLLGLSSYLHQLSAHVSPWIETLITSKLESKLLTHT